MLYLIHPVGGIYHLSPVRHSRGAGCTQKIMRLGLNSVEHYLTIRRYTK